MPRSPLPQATGTTLYVNAEQGNDAFNGLTPARAFKTVTKALQTIAGNPAIGSGPPFTVRIAGRWHQGLVPPRPYLYGNSPGAPEYSGETFPLQVPPRTLLKADAPNSELDPTSGPPGNQLLVPAILEGPLFAGPTTPPSPAFDTIEFKAGWSPGGDGDGFGAEGGLDGSEIAPFGIVVRGGLRNVYLEASRSLPRQWAQIPPDPMISAIVPVMGIRMEKVWFSGRAAYDLDAHVENGAIGTYRVSNCKFTTDESVCVDTTGPVPHGTHTGQALVHVFATSSTGPPPAWASPAVSPLLQPTFSENELGVLPGASGLPEVRWGIVIEPSIGADAFVSVSSTTIEGGSIPGTTAGIAVGIEFASNTGNPSVGGRIKIPHFELVNCRIVDCGVFGAALATGAAGTHPTVTRVEVSGNQFFGNGASPWGVYNSCSTHEQYRGTGLHLVCRFDGSWFLGTIDKNEVTGNRNGIALSSASTLPNAGVPVPSFPDPHLTISRNVVSGQTYYDSPPVLPAAITCTNTNLCTPADNGSGVGILVAKDVGSIAGPGVLDSRLHLEANLVSENEGHGVWIRGTTAGDISPLLRNNRIWRNGAGTPPAGYDPGDGVRIEFIGGMSGGTLAPRLIHEDIWGHDKGFGVFSDPAAAPEVWNSIVRGNVLSDLSAAFTFGASGTGPVVWFSNFCGPPWTVACIPPQPTPGAGNNYCELEDPLFLAPGIGNFELICGRPPGPCASPAHDSGVDPSAAFVVPYMTDPSILAILPFLPTEDAEGSPRLLDLVPTPGPSGTIADMGALEKQSFTP